MAQAIHLGDDTLTYATDSSCIFNNYFFAGGTGAGGAGGVAGTDGLGGGGGGQDQSGASSGAGGSGVVIIKYLGGADNMTLVSESTEAEANPDNIRMFIVEEGTDNYT